MDLLDIISPLQDCVLQEKKSLMICVIFSFDFYSWQVSGLPGKAFKEMDDGRKSNVKKLVKLGDEMLASPCMEHLPYGGQVQVLDRSKLRTVSIGLLSSLYKSTKNGVQIHMFIFMTCVFECFQSHCHILKELYDFLCMMGAITIFEESIFIFNFVVMDW